MGGRSDSVEWLLVPYVFSSASVTFAMPFTFSVAEYADMIYVHGFCDGNSVHAVAEYQQHFPNGRIPTRRVFTSVYQTLRDTSTLPGVRIAAEHDVNEGVDEEEGIVQTVQSNTCASTQRTVGHLRVPHTSVENTACRGHVSIPRAVSATSRTWQFCGEARILQVAQWQLPVASLHPVY